MPGKSPWRPQSFLSVASSFHSWQTHSWNTKGKNRRIQYLYQSCIKFINSPEIWTIIYWKHNFLLNIYMQQCLRPIYRTYSRIWMYAPASPSSKSRLNNIFLALLELFDIFVLATQHEKNKNSNILNSYAFGRALEAVWPAKAFWQFWYCPISSPQKGYKL